MNYIIFIGLVHMSMYEGHGSLTISPTTSGQEITSLVIDLNEVTGVQQSVTENITTSFTESITTSITESITTSIIDSNTTENPTSLSTDSSTSLNLSSIRITPISSSYINSDTVPQLTDNSFITSSIPSSTTLDVFSSVFTLSDLQTSTGISMSTSSPKIMTTEISSLQMSSASGDQASLSDSSEFSSYYDMTQEETSSPVLMTSSNEMGPLNTSDYVQSSLDKTYFSTSDLQSSHMTPTVEIQPSASYYTSTSTQYEISSRSVSVVSSHVITTPGVENVGSSATSEVLPTSHISVLPSSSDLFESTSTLKMEESTSVMTSSPNPLQGQFDNLQQRFNDLENTQSQYKIAVGLLSAITVLLILAIVLYFFWRRRRHQQKQREIFSTDDDLKTDVQTRHKPYMNTHVALGSGPDGRYSAASLGESVRGGTQLNTFGGTKQPASTNGAPKLETVMDTDDGESESKDKDSNKDVSLNMENLPPPPSPGDFNKEEGKEETTELLSRDDDKT